MYIVTVLFEIQDAHVTEFHHAVVQQARNSLQLEADCHVFDVCVGIDNPAEIYLYERYTSRAAFDDHLSSAHFKAFDQQVMPWVRSKTVQAYRNLGDD